MNDNSTIIAFWVAMMIATIVIVTTMLIVDSINNEYCKKHHLINKEYCDEK
jgi:hypothetical protein